MRKRKGVAKKNETGVMVAVGGRQHRKKRYHHLPAATNMPGIAGLERLHITGWAAKMLKTAMKELLAISG